MKKLLMFLILAIALVGIVNAAPTLNSISSKSVNEGSTLSFLLTTSVGPDSGSTSFTKNESHGTLTKVNNTLANFTWTPGFTESGTYSFTFNASDSNSSSLQTVTVTVSDVSNSANLVVSNPTIGDSSQERNENTSTTFTITNNGTDTLSSISVSDNAASKYKISYANTPSTLTAGQSQTVTVTGFITEDFDAVDGNLEESAFSIGTITVSGTGPNGTSTATSTLKMQAENRLEIDKVRVTVDDSTDSASDGDTVKDIKPGDELSVEVVIDNLYSDDEDVDFEDIEVSIEIDDNDFDVDEEDEIDIDADEQDSITFDFDADDEADGTVTMVIRVDGTDEEGGRHGEEWEVKLKVDRESHELDLRRLSLSPTTISCDGSLTTSLKVNLLNIGKKDEDDVTVQLLSTPLELDETKDFGDLEKDDSSTRSFTINVPSDVEDGAHSILVTAFFESGSEADSGSVSLNVQGCDAKPAVEFEDTESDATATATTTSSSSGRSASVGRSGFTGDLSTTVLVVLVIAAVGVIAYLWQQLLALKK